MEPAQTKICSKCGEERGMGEFRKDKNRRLGIKPSCKVCEHNYYLKNKTRIIQKSKKYHENNREEILKKQHEYTLKNKNKLYEKQKEWRKNNWKRKRENDKKYYELNKEKISVTGKIYQLRFQYCLSLEEYELLKKTFPVCCLCKKPNNLPGKELAIDHDHNSTKIVVRGLLCLKCNTNLLSGYEAIRFTLPPNQRWSFLEEYLNNPPAQKVLRELDNPT